MVDTSACKPKGNTRVKKEKEKKRDFFVYELQEQFICSGGLNVDAHF